LRDPGRERRAEQRARELLRSCVNDEEWGMYRDLGFIRVTGRLWRKDRGSAYAVPRRDDDADEDERDFDELSSGVELSGGDDDPRGEELSGGDEHDFDHPDDAGERTGRRTPRRLPNNEPDTLQRRRREAAARARDASARDGAGAHAAARGAANPADDAPYAYLIYPHKPIVAYVPKTGRLLSEYCVEFPDLTGAISQTRLPDSDDVLAKWMALTGDEERLIRNANMHLPGRQVDPNRVRRDLWRLSEWERQRRGYGPVRAPRS
jgi:hypothetical protein